MNHSSPRLNAKAMNGPAAMTRNISVVMAPVLSACVELFKTNRILERQSTFLVSYGIPFTAYRLPYLFFCKLR